MPSLKETVKIEISLREGAATFIYDECSSTDNRGTLYNMACGNVVIKGDGQDLTYEDFKKNPDLVIGINVDGYAGYSTVINVQVDAL